MAVDLADFVESLKREVTPPDSTLYATTRDEVFSGYLMDAFWEAKLDGFLGPWRAEDTVVTHVSSDADLPREQVALIVIYAGIKILRNRLISLQQSMRAEAGPVSFETKNSATVMAEMLRQLQALKDRILEAGQEETTVALIDALTVRQISRHSYYGRGLDSILELSAGG